MKKNVPKINKLKPETKVRILSVAVLAVSALFALSQAALAAPLYSRTPSGDTVTSPVTFNVSGFADADEICGVRNNVSNMHYWYVAPYDGINDHEYYPPVDQIVPIEDMSGSWTIEIDEGATITTVFTACLETNEDFSTENGGYTLEDYQGDPLIAFTVTGGGGGGGGGGSFNPVSFGSMGTTIATGAGGILKNHLGIVFSLAAALIGIGILIYYTRRTVGGLPSGKKKGFRFTYNDRGVRTGFDNF